MVALRFISRKLRFQGNVAAVAIAVSFFVMIVAVAVSAGFRHTLRAGVAAMTGDIRIAPYTSGGADPVPMHAQLPSLPLLEEIDGVQSITPAVVRAGIVKTGDLVHGVVVKGVPDTAGAPADSIGALPVSIPYRLAEITGLGIGDKLAIYFVGEKVRVRQFSITSLHRDILEADDNLLVYARLEDMQRLNGWSSDQVSSLDVRLGRAFRSRKQVQDVSALMGHILLNSTDEEEQSLYVSSSIKAYPQVFDWLDLLDFNVLIILLLMTVVAGFNMVSGLLIMLLRNVSLIGTLKTMGMEDREVGRLFLRIGARAAFKGMLAGNALAILFCLIQGSTHLIPLDPANYFVSWVPVHVNLPWILLADALAFLAILALLWLPTLLVARIDPAATVKAE